MAVTDGTRGKSKSKAAENRVSGQGLGAGGDPPDGGTDPRGRAADSGPSGGASQRRSSSTRTSASNAGAAKPPPTFAAGIDLGANDGTGRGPYDDDASANEDDGLPGAAPPVPFDPTGPGGGAPHPTADDVERMRDMFRGLGLFDEAAKTFTDDQGLQTLEDFALLDDDAVKTLCATTRKPGGQVPDGNGGFRSNFGARIALKSELQLKLATFYLRYCQRVSRPLMHDYVKPNIIYRWKALKEYEDQHSDPDPPEINANDWTKTMEGIDEWLRGCLGIDKTPLAHVVRENHEIPPHKIYQTRAQELIERYPHWDLTNPGEFTANYLADCERVWELISELCRTHECWTFVRKAQKERNGREAYMNLKNHYLGPSHIDAMAKAAEERLTTLTYTGEQRRWNFQKYVKGHVDQHIILEGLVQHGYSGIDKRTKVRHLMDGIKCDALNPVKSTIIANQEYRHDFDKCVGLFVDFLGLSKNKTKNHVRDVTVAAITSESGGVRPDMSVQDRYYKKEEYRALSKAKKLGLKRKREARGHGGGAKKRRKPSSTVDARTIKAIVAAMEEVKETKKDKETSDEAKDGNRNNPALRRE